MLPRAGGNTPIKGVVLMFQGTIKHTKPMTVAFLAMHGPYDRMGEDYGRLYEGLASRGLTPEGMPETVYLTNPAEVPDADAEWELWAPVEGSPAEQPAADSDPGLKHVEHGTVASAMHRGPYDTLPSTYDALMHWIDSHGFEISGPPREVYLSDPADVQPEATLTEIQVPIASV